MSILDIERILKHLGAKEIDNSTLTGTFVMVEAEKFFTKGISNRDNARWKRAQYIIINHCPPTSINRCLEGFLQFSEMCQFLIIANTNQVYNGNGKPIDLYQLLTKR